MRPAIRLCPNKWTNRRDFIWQIFIHARYIFFSLFLLSFCISVRKFNYQVSDVETEERTLAKWWYIDYNSRYVKIVWQSQSNESSLRTPVARKHARKRLLTHFATTSIKPTLCYSLLTVSTSMRHIFCINSVTLMVHIWIHFFTTEDGLLALTKQ